MREIKFRGKNIETNEWVYGYFYIHEPPLKCLSEEHEGKLKYYIARTQWADWNMERPMELIEIIPETASQFTGYLDKNRKEIYENDIVKYGRVLSAILLLVLYIAGVMQIIALCSR